MERADEPKTPAGREAARILAFAGQDRVKAFDIVERQFGVLVIRTQVMLSLSGIVITVTGFSGRAIAQTSALARGCVAGGIVIVLLAAVVAITGVLRLTWLTNELGDDPHRSIERAVALRDRKSRFLTAALGLFVLGFALYVVAIAQLLIATPTLDGS